MRPGLRVLSVVVLAALSSAIAYASVSFTQKTNAGAASSTHADLNNDGREDFVYSADNGAGVQVQLSTGDGDYAAPVNYPLPGGATVDLVTIADFNSDGTADLFVLGTTGGTQTTAYIFFNSGAGTFALGSQFTTAALGSNVSGLVAADFNHDGRMDVAITQYPYVSVWLGDGKGQFTAGPQTQVQYAGALMLGDFDGDARADLAISDFTNYQNVQILYGDGSGAFPDTRFIKLPVGYHSLPGVTDVNSDGRTDIVAATFYPNNPNYISVYYGRYDRNWTANTIIPVSHCAGREVPVAADVNGDGINDLIVPESDCNNDAETTHYVGVLTRKPNSSYNGDQIVYTSSAPDMIIKDFTVIRANSDTRPDIAFSQCISTPCTLTSDFQQKILLNTTAGAFHGCDAPNAFIGINVCSPAGTYMNTTVNFSIGAAGQTAMRKVEVWVDGKKLGEQLNGFSKYSFFDRTFDINPGTHQVDIYGAGIDNYLVRKSYTLTVQ